MHESFLWNMRGDVTLERQGRVAWEKSQRKQGWDGNLQTTEAYVMHEIWAWSSWEPLSNWKSEIAKTLGHTRTLRKGSSMKYFAYTFLFCWERMRLCSFEWEVESEVEFYRKLVLMGYPLALTEVEESLRIILSVGCVCPMNIIFCQALVESSCMLSCLNPNVRFSSGFKCGRYGKDYNCRRTYISAWMDSDRDSYW